MTFLNTHNERRVTLVLFGLFVLWQLVGILPFTAYEADAVSVCAGCEYTYRNCWSTLGDMGYGYWLQPLSYAVIVMFRHILPGLPCETVYAALSSLSAIVFQALTIVFVTRTTHIRPVYVLLALMLLPESYALAMYPNTTAFCAALFAGALCLITARKYIPAAILLLVAPLMRIDVLVIYPVIPFILASSGMSWRKSLALTAIFAVIVAGFTWLIYRAMGTDALFALGEHSRWSDKLPASKNLLAVFGFYGIVSVILVPAGLIIAARQRRRMIITMTLCAIVFVHLVQLNFANASKHFALLIPFVIILSALALGKLAAVRNRLPAKIAIGLIVLSQLTGIRLTPAPDVTSTSQFNSDIPAPLAVDVSLIGLKAQLVIGGGQTVMTADEAVITSGNFFYPFFIHNLKTNGIERQSNFITCVRNNPTAVYVYPSWEEMSRVHLLEQTGDIPDGIAIKDDRLEEYLQDSENTGKNSEIAEHFRRTYGDRPAFLFITEPISHRWRKTINTLVESGIAAPEGTSRTVYRITHCEPFTAVRQQPHSSI